MTHFRAAERSIALLLVLAGLGVLVGWLLGQAGFGMAGGLLLWSALQLRQLLRLQRWLASRRMHAPESEGAWQPIFDSLERRRKADRRRRRRLLEALDAFRDAARALPDGIIAIDDTDTIHWFNKSAKRLLGLRYPTDVGNHLTHLVRSPRFVQWLGEGRLDDPLIVLHLLGRLAQYILINLDIPVRYILFAAVVDQRLQDGHRYTYGGPVRQERPPQVMS